jgi:release factor glutamine methyltransferase
LTFNELVGRLRAAGCVFAEDEARLLQGSGRDVPGLVERRVAGEPLEYLLGWAEFCGRRFAVEAPVFVPRRRTELLVREALRRASGATVVLELCCGSAAVAAVLAAEWPAADVHATDVDPAAVRCARRNLPAARVHEGDLYAALPPTLRGRVDVLVANAPYVPTGEIAMMPAEARDHEAPVALDGGADGLDLHRRIAAGAPEWLAPGGWLLIETSRHQAGRTAALAERAGLAAEVVTCDELDATAVVARRRQGAPPRQGSQPSSARTAT